MPVPFETLLPYGIIVAMFAVSGSGLATVHYVWNGGKRQRWSLDQWDRCMRAVMIRDQRLTGYVRGQTDNPRAPDKFYYNNPWRTERGIA